MIRITPGSKIRTAYGETFTVTDINSLTFYDDYMDRKYKRKKDGFAVMDRRPLKYPPAGSYFVSSDLELFIYNFLVVAYHADGFVRVHHRLCAKKSLTEPWERAYLSEPEIKALCTLRNPDLSAPFNKKIFQTWKTA